MAKPHQHIGLHIGSQKLPFTGEESDFGSDKHGKAGYRGERKQSKEMRSNCDGSQAEINNAHTNKEEWLINAYFKQHYYLHNK